MDRERGPAEADALLLAHGGPRLAALEAALRLLRAILDAPEDDAPRLVYADWLDEHAGPVACDYCGGRDQCPKGDGTFDEHWHCPRCDGKSNGYAERAEFIRVQCRLAQRPWTSKDMIRTPSDIAYSHEDLPGDIWKLLPEDGRTGHRGTSPYWAWYPSNEAADTALSRACVAYGRSLAKLPALAPVT
jgi:uncharacterized protein (TIGR02996 family)